MMKKLTMKIVPVERILFTKSSPSRIFTITISVTIPNKRIVQQKKNDTTLIILMVRYGDPKFYQIMLSGDGASVIVICFFPITEDEHLGNIL